MKDRKEYMRRYVMKNREKVRAYQAEWYRKNRDRELQKSRIRGLKRVRHPLTNEQKAKMRATSKAWAKKNPGRFAEYTAAYRQRVKETPEYKQRVKAHARKAYDRIMADPVLRDKERARKRSERTHDNRKRRHHERKVIDLNYAISRRLRGRILMAVRRNTKSARTMQLLGCSIEELKVHLQSGFGHGMSWENFGLWHIDHIRPCASFDLSDPDQQRVCFNWKNLQPLWAVDNIRKSDKIAA